MNEADDYLKMMNKATAMRGSELKSQFKTMLFSYRNALSMLSGLKNELDEVVSHIDNLDIKTISNFYKPVLEKANDLVSEIEDLDGEMKNHTDMKEYLSSIKTQLKSHNINTWVKKFDEVKYQIIKAKEAEERRKEEFQRQRNEEAKRQAELERQRREAKEAEERRKQELQRQRNEEAKRQAELERKQMEAKEAEERRRQELQRQRNEESKRQAELERQRNEEAKRQAELEQQEVLVFIFLSMYISAFISIGNHFLIYLIVIGPFSFLLHMLYEEFGRQKFNNVMITIYNKYTTLHPFIKLIFWLINLVISFSIYD